METARQGRGNVNRAAKALAGRLGFVLVVGSLLLVLSAGPSLADRGDCGQPITDGLGPVATDAGKVLRFGVGADTCSDFGAPDCICDVNDSGGTTASDALLVLQKAVGQNVTLDCGASCIVTTTTAVTTTTMSTTTTTMGGGNIAAGLADYDARCAFCHAAGAHDTVEEFASDLAQKGGLLVGDLGTLDAFMTGLMLDGTQLLNMDAFLSSL